MYKLNKDKINAILFINSNNKYNMLAFWVSILITLILKITTICFITNDLLECVAKLSKIHKTQVGKDQIK